MKKQALFSGLADALGGTTEAQIAANSIGYGGTAFVLAALARAMVQQRDPHESYAGVDTAKQVDTTMKDPLVTEDIADDIKRSVKSQSKSANVSKKAVTLSDVAKWAVPVGSVALGGALGYKLVDDIYDKSTAKKLNEEKAILSSLHKKVVMARALNARGQLSESMYRDILMEAQPLLAKQAMYRHLNKTAGGDHVFKDWAAPALGLALSVAFAASAYGAHNYFASRNVNRLRHSAIKEGLGEYAMQQSVMRPIEHSLTDDPKVKAMLESIEAKKKAEPTETPMIHTAVTI